MEQTEVKISKRLLQILKGMSVINDGIILKKDYIYTKDETEGSKSQGLVVEFKLQPDDLALVNEIGVKEISRLLRVIDSCDYETLNMNAQGTQISIKDNRKKLTYNTQLVDSLPIKDPRGDELYEQGEPMFSFILDDIDRDRIQKDLTMVNVDSFKLKGENGKLKIIGDSSITSDEVQIDVNTETLEICTDDEFVFMNKDSLNLIVAGSYKIQVRKVSYSGRIIKIMKLESIDYPGLVYTTVSYDA